MATVAGVRAGVAGVTIEVQRGGTRRETRVAGQRVSRRSRGPCRTCLSPWLEAAVLAQSCQGRAGAVGVWAPRLRRAGPERHWRGNPSG